MNRKSFLLAALGLPLMALNVQAQVPGGSILEQTAPQANVSGYEIKVDVVLLDAQGQVQQQEGAPQGGTLTVKPGTPSAFHATKEQGYVAEWALVGRNLQAVTKTFVRGVHLELTATPDMGDIRLQWKGTLSRLVGPADGFVVVRQDDKELRLPQIVSVERAGDILLIPGKPREVMVPVAADGQSMRLIFTATPKG